MRPIFVYVACKNDEEASALGKTLVSEQLAACANIIPGMRSIYMWKGELSEDQETVLVLKSHMALFEEMKQRVSELHSYEVPGLVAMPIVDGYLPYLEWMAGEMKV